MPQVQKKKSKARPPKPEGAKSITPMRPVAVLPNPDRHGLEKYQDHFADQAAYMCSLGATDQDLCAWFGIDEGTLRSWCFKYPEFGQGLKSGKSAADDRVERSLYMNAVGYEYTVDEIVKLKNGDSETYEVVPVKRYQQPNTSAQIFWLKNRRKDFWRDVHQLEHGRAGEFSALSDKDLAQRMLQSAKDIEQLQKELEGKKR